MALPSNVLGLLYFLAGAGSVLFLILICNKLFNLIKKRKLREYETLLDTVIDSATTK